MSLKNILARVPIYLMRAVSVALSGLAGSPLFHLMIPGSVPEENRWPLALFMSGVLSLAFGVNESEKKPLIAARNVLRAGSVLGVIVVVFGQVNNLTRAEYIAQLDLKGYEAIVNTTEENARDHVLKSQRESAGFYRGNLEAAGGGDDAAAQLGGAFFTTMADIARELDGAIPAVIVIGLLAGVLAITAGGAFDYASMIFWRRGRPETRSIFAPLIDALGATFRFLGGVLAKAYELLGDAFMFFVWLFQAGAYVVRRLIGHALFLLDRRLSGSSAGEKKNADNWRVNPPKNPPAVVDLPAGKMADENASDDAENPPPGGGFSAPQAPRRPADKPARKPPADGEKNRPQIAAATVAKINRVISKNPAKYKNRKGQLVAARIARAAKVGESTVRRYLEYMLSAGGPWDGDQDGNGSPSTPEGD